MIVHVTPTYLGKDSLVGGGERYATELAKAMARVTPTRLISFGSTTRRERWGSLDVHIYKPLFYGGGLRWNPFSTAFVSSLRDAEVIHCHQFSVLSTSLSLLWGRWKCVPVFVTDLGGGAAGWFIHRLRPERWVRAFLSISRYAAQTIRSMGSAHVVGAGINTDVFQPRPVKKKEGVLFVGRIRPAKGIHLLIEAVPSDVSLRIVGPVLDQTYFGQLKRAGAGKQVVFEPPCPDSELTHYYSKAQVTVLPSLPCTELLGLVLLESLACGTPVICTRIGAPEEIVRDGENGLTVPPNDPQALRRSIQWIRAHPSEAEAMGTRGREAVLKNFTWDAVVQRCLQAYASSARDHSP